MEMFITNIDNLSYITVERAILQHYQMGRQNTSDVPPKLTEEYDSIHKIYGTEKYGEFHIIINKADEGYQMIVSDYTLKSNR